MFVITEEERKQILSKYSEGTSDELLTYLKRYFPAGETKLDWMEKPKKYISIGEKIRYVDGNKKYLIGRIDSEIEEQWINLTDKVRRRTIKKYIDGISTSY